MDDLRDQLLAELPEREFVPPERGALQHRSRRRKRRRAGWAGTVTAAAIGAVVLVATGTLSTTHERVLVGGGTAGSPTTGSVTQNVPVARDFATSLVEEVPLPPGAKVAHHLPAGLPSQPGEAMLTSNAVNATGFWTLNMTRTQAVQYLQQHEPAPTQLQSQVGFQAPIEGVEYEAFYANNPPQGVQQALVTVAIASTPVGSAVRIDAEVIWIPLRSTEESISAGITAVTIQDDGYSPPHSVTLTDLTAITAVTDAFNQLSAIPSIFCVGGPIMKGVDHSYTLSFVDYGSKNPSLTAGTTGCGSIAVQIHGQEQPQLRPTDQFRQLLQALTAGSKLFATFSLPSETLVSGTSVIATVDVYNLTGKTVRVGTCGEPFPIKLVPPDSTPTPPPRPLCLQPLILMSGRSTFQTTVSTIESCSQTSPAAGCVDDQPHPLPRGEYEAALFAPATIINQPDPTPVTVTG